MTARREEKGEFGLSFKGLDLLCINSDFAFCIVLTSDSKFEITAGEETERPGVILLGGELICRSRKRLVRLMTKEGKWVNTGLDF